MTRLIKLIVLIFYSNSLVAQSYDSCLIYYKKAQYKKVIDIYYRDQSLQLRLIDSIDLFDAVTTSLINSGDYGKAKILLKRVNFDSGSLFKAVYLNNLGLIYNEQLDFDSALYCLNQALRIRTHNVSKDDPLLAESYFNLGILFTKMGVFDRAEEYLNKTLSIDSKNLPPTDPTLASTLNNLAVVNEDFGRYSKAIQYYSKASTIFSVNPGKSSYQYGLVHFNIAKAFSRLQQPDSALRHLTIANEVLTAANIFTTEFGLLKLGIITGLISEGKLKQAEEIILITEQEWQQTAAWKFILPEVLLVKATLRHKQNRMDEAFQFVSEGITAFEKNYRTTDINIVNLLDFKARLFFIKKDYDQYFITCQAIQQLVLSKILVVFPSLSEKEREQFYFTYRPYFEKFASLLLEDTPPKETAGQLYNNQLATKAILLNYTNRWKRQILSSGDLELIKSFTHWQELKSQLQEGDDRPNNKATDSLEDAVNALEKKLSSRSELFAKHIDNKKIDWRSIQDSLKRNEAAIEIIRFRKFDFFKNTFTNEVIYAALIVTAATRNDPKAIILRNGNEIETRSLKQYRNAILFKQKDEVSYNQFWKPIKAALKGIDKVYFSPDGIFNVINFNTLRNPENGKFLLDEIQFRLVTNIKDILTDNVREEYNKYALLFGGPDYKAKVKNENIINRSPAPTLRSYQAVKLVRGKSLAFLPGAKKEVEDIRDLMEINRWNVDLFEGENALEENLKHSLKPKLLHIATHGYFQQDESGEGNQRGAENLLHRSGLMFAGASNSIDDTETIQDMATHEDGILTAYEAMNLNLENTELVVLSACETGLGEIKNGEGVYGLQRAFKVAGANNLMMSLWKVDDEVTQQLMDLFYKDWLITNDKYGALTRAQQIIKAKHPEPYYWGGFVLVGK